MTKKRGKNKRTGSKWVMTKRSPENKHNHEKKVDYEVRMLNRAKYFKLKLKETFK